MLFSVKYNSWMSTFYKFIKNTFLLSLWFFSSSIWSQLFLVSRLLKKFTGQMQLFLQLLHLRRLRMNFLGLISRNTIRKWGNWLIISRWIIHWIPFCYCMVPFCYDLSARTDYYRTINYVLLFEWYNLHVTKICCPSF